MNKTVVINGRALTRQVTGIQRYGIEILKELDKMVPDQYRIELLIPESSELAVSFKNIQIIKIKDSIEWDILRAESYAKKKNALYVNFANKGGFYKKSIVTVHDIRPLRLSNGRDIKSKKTKIKFWIGYNLAIKNAKILVAVSEFTKDEIVQFSKKDPADIRVIFNGWNHIIDLPSDETIIDKAQLKRGEYYLSISSIAPHKNFEWIIKNAAKNPNEKYVIVGKVSPKLWNTNGEIFQNNVAYLGYLSDEEIKALLINCKALIFPSTYEGFGIPPLEALACKTNAIVSDIPVLKEIFKESVYYIDPANADVSLNAIMQNPVEGAEDVLNKYTWHNAAAIWMDLIKEYA